MFSHVRRLILLQKLTIKLHPIAMKWGVIFATINNDWWFPPRQTHFFPIFIHNFIKIAYLPKNTKLTRFNCILIKVISQALFKFSFRCIYKFFSRFLVFNISTLFCLLPCLFRQFTAQVVFLVILTPSFFCLFLFVHNVKYEILFYRPGPRNLCIWIRFWVHTEL